MPDLQKEIPAYLMLKSNIVRLILFTAFFALIFINVYAPFGVDVWFHTTRWQLLLYSSVITLTGVLVVVISRIIMYHTRRTKLLRLWQYLVWVLAEVFFMGLFYTLYQKLILHDPRFFPDLLALSVQNTALVLLLPYSVLWLYFSWEDKKIRLEKIRKEGAPDGPVKGMVHFCDERGGLRFSLKAENLLYLEAADNYVYIHYLDNGKLSRHLLRSNLKRLDGELQDSALVRCHRSYMVNSEKVSLIRREKEGLRIEMEGIANLSLPVSPTYATLVIGALTRNKS
ncbi:protein containing LytTr DNA-binding domain [Lentimicrobium saccharophilum]|uniref:Protein containing LytTr DNA-binding domain n=1 Tax=Lentimicrobium saccharophilum TaxID=1678841 RepID=A0A0S7BS09_9BACT|nr:LytTR family transcriptional regulator DNA-binding domain-containing protein [Lentimicrobium saccharophilum]GAP43685.1 protein containing LytTr DNA-binding domain [Lentimicrobium saccharophilum]